MPRASAKTSTAKKRAIHKSMLIADIVALCPDAKDALAEYGLLCIGCAGNAFETLQEGCAGHGFSELEIDDLVSDLNALLERVPATPQTLTLTLPAARAIRDIALREKRQGEGLAVTVDGQGGFCMEFHRDAAADESVFFHPQAKDVRIFASGLTLRRIGGSTIDFRDGRFKLDLPDRDGGCGCGGACACKGHQ